MEAISKIKKDVDNNAIYVNCQQKLATDVYARTLI